MSTRWTAATNARWISSLVIGVLILFALAACGARGEPPVPATAESQDTPVSQEEAEEEVGQTPEAAPTQAPTPTVEREETESSKTAEPTVVIEEPESTATPQPTVESAASEQDEAESETGAQNEAETEAAGAGDQPDEPLASVGLAPGEYIYSNGNLVRDIALHEGALWAATEGGVVSYDLASGEATKLTTLDGLPYNITVAVEPCPLPEPRLIFALESGGLAIYDPASGEWEMGSEIGLDLANEKVYSMLCDPATNRLIVEMDGIAVFDLTAGEVRTYTAEDGLLDSYSTPKFAVRGEEIWALYDDDGISVVAADGAITNLTAEDGTLPTNALNDLAVAPDGSVWIGSEAGLLHIQDGQVTTYQHEDFPYFGPGYLAFAADGALWLNMDDGMCQWAMGEASCASLHPFRETEGMSFGTGGVIELVTDDQGNVAYATGYDGSSAWTGSGWRRFFLENQLPLNSISDVQQDNEGNIWISGSGGSAPASTTLEAEQWETFPDVYSMEALPTEDGIWFQSNYILSFYDGDQVTQLKRDETEGMLNTNINTIGIDSQGRLYVGHDGGVSIQEGDSFVPIGQAEGWIMENVREFLAIEDSMYAATTKGVVRFDGSEWETIVDESMLGAGLPAANVGALGLWTDGSLILGTTSGLAYYKDGALRAEETSIGSVYDIDVMPNGDIWVAALSTGGGVLGAFATGEDDGGIFHYDGSSWTHWGIADGLPAESATTVHVDDAGTIWAGTYAGLYRVVP